jgi:ankyrin repeat protein
LRAIQDGTIAAVQLFIELGVKMSAVRHDGAPAIVVAATACGYEPKEPRPQVIASLLKAGANPNARDSNNATPLIWAAEFCPADAVKMLLELGADVNARANGGATPLMMAQTVARPEIVAVLEAAGAQ